MSISVRKKKLSVTVDAPMSHVSRTESFPAVGWLHDLERDGTVIRDLLSRHRIEEKDGVHNVRQLVSMKDVEAIISAKDAEICRIQSLLDFSNSTIAGVCIDIDLLRKTLYNEIVLP